MGQWFEESLKLQDTVIQADIYTDTGVNPTKLVTATQGRGQKGVVKRSGNGMEVGHGNLKVVMGGLDDSCLKCSSILFQVMFRSNS